MKNKLFFLINTLIIGLIIVFSFIACGGDKSELLPPSEEITTGGRLTITGLSSYIGKSININIRDLPPPAPRWMEIHRFTLESYNSVWKVYYSSNAFIYSSFEDDKPPYGLYNIYPVNGDSVTLNIYKLLWNKTGDSYTSGDIENYNGSDEFVKFTVYDVDGVYGSGRGIGSVIASFIDGVGTGEFLESE